jgi:hypothetical protein
MDGAILFRRIMPIGFMKYAFFSRILALPVIAFLLPVMAAAQSVTLVRTDVDSARAHFITATMRFGVDITLRDAPGCNAATMDITFSNANVVRYSGWSAGSFPRRNVVVVDLSDPTTNTGRLSITAFSGNPAPDSGVNNPVIIHLDFVTMPDAVHNTLCTFGFINPLAVLNKNNGSAISLNSQSISYTIRSWIDVWPGDADNNGVVDSRDGIAIGLYLTNSASESRFRGFRRPSASTVWAPQTVLAWDSAQATFADCDGNGEVTTTDALILALNTSKRRSTIGPGGGKPLAAPVNTDKAQENPLPAGYKKIAIPVQADEPIIGATARISWAEDLANEKYKVIGFESGTLFEGDESVFISKIYPETNSADLVSCSLNPSRRNNIQAGILAYMIVDPLGSDAIPHPMLQNPIGLSAPGLFLPLRSTTLAADNSPVRGGDVFSDALVAVQGQLLCFLPTQPGIAYSYTLHTLTGNAVASGTINGFAAPHSDGSFVQVPVHAVGAGFYYLCLKTPGHAPYSFRCLIY